MDLLSQMGKKFKRLGRALDYLKDAKKEMTQKEKDEFVARGGGGDDDDWGDFADGPTSLEGDISCRIGAPFLSLRDSKPFLAILIKVSVTFYRNGAHPGGE